MTDDKPFPPPEAMMPLAKEIALLMFDDLHPVERQQTIEWLIVMHAMNVTGHGKIDACYVVDAIAKHCKQFITENIHMILDGR